MAAPRRHLAGGAMVAVGVQLVTLATAAPTSIVIARAVGPAGTGSYSLSVALMASAVVIFGIGLSAGFVYYVSRGDWPPGWAWRRAESSGALLGLVAGAAVIGAQLAAHDRILEGVSLRMAVALACALPFALAWTQMSAIALALERYELFGVAQAVQPAAAFLGVVVLIWPLDVFGAVLAVAVSYPIAWLALRVRLARLVPREDAAPRERFGAAVRFSLRAWGANFLQLLNYRLDLFLLNAYVARSTVGHYSIAVSLTALAWVLPSGLQTVLFPRAASAPREGEDPDETAVVALRHTLVLLTISAAGLAVVLALIPLVYGSDFRRSVGYGFLLLPGVLALGFAKPLSAIITGRGFPQYSLYNSLITTPITVALYLLLLPGLGGTGAAIASTVSYVLSMLIALVYFKRVTGVALRRVLASPRSLAGDYVRAARNVRARLPQGRYRPERYWEKRSRELIATYDAPETWAARGWAAQGVEEEAVPRLLRAAGVRSVFVVGAGSGRQYAFLEPLGLELRGIDISPTMAAECRRRFPGITTVADTVVGADARHAPADVVLSSAVLQHVPPADLPAALAAVQRLADRLVVIRELSWLVEGADYLWAHDYASAFAGWRLVHDQVTDETDRYEVRLRAWERPR